MIDFLLSFLNFCDHGITGSLDFDRHNTAVSNEIILIDCSTRL